MALMKTRFWKGLSAPGVEGKAHCLQRAGLHSPRRGAAPEVYVREFVILAKVLAASRAFSLSPCPPLHPMERGERGVRTAIAQAFSPCPLSIGWRGGAGVRSVNSSSFRPFQALVRRLSSGPGGLGTASFGIPIVKILLCTALAAMLANSALGADTFNWNINQNRVTADVQSGNLSTVLGKIIAATGWQIYIEPGTTHTVSAKFKNLPPGDALRLLLGDLNFALVPETNSSSKLFVFRTFRQNATELVRAPKLAGARLKVITNERIVTLNPGA